MSGAGGIQQGPVQFVPAGNIKDAEKWLKDSLSGGKKYVTNEPKFKNPKAIADNLDKINLIGYKKLSLDEANAFNKVFKEVNSLCDDLDIPRIRGINFKTTGVAEMGDGVLSINRYKIKGLVDKGTLGESEVSKWRFGDFPKFRPDLTDKYFKTVSSRRESIIWHEIGHHIEQQYKVTNVANYARPHIEESFKQIFHEYRLKVDSPSKYGSVDTHEFFAENFSLFQAGKEELLKDDIVDIFNKIYMGEF